MDDDVARQRLLVYTIARFGGVASVFLGIAIMYTNLVRPGGWPQVGAIIAIGGVIEAMFIPRLIKRAWDKQDESQE